MARIWTQNLVLCHISLKFMHHLLVRLIHNQLTVIKQHLCCNLTLEICKARKTQNLNVFWLYIDVNQR